MTFLTTPGVHAQEAISILRGSLADRLAQSAGDNGPDLGNAGDPEETLPTGSASLTEDDIEDRTTSADEEGVDDSSNEEAASAVASRQVGDDAGETRESTRDDLETSESEFSIRSGYDTNYDELVDPEASPFVEINGAFEVEQTVGGTDIFASADLTFLELPDLDVEERFFGETALAVRREIFDGIFLDGAISAALDADDTAISLETASAVGVQVVRDEVAAGLRFSFASDDVITDRVGETSFEDRYEDYRRYSVESTILARPLARVSPILSVQASRVAFPIGIYPSLLEGEDVGEVDDIGGHDGEDETLVPIDRDAHDASIAPGFRLRPWQGLTINLAGRANMRSFDAPYVPTLYTVFPDIQVLFELAEDFELDVSVTRIIDEPEDFGSYAQDVKTYAAAVAYKPSLGLGGTIEGGFSEIDEYGVRSESTETFIGADLSYRWSESLAGRVDVSANWTNDKSSDEDTKTVQFGGALVFKF
ncbi:hypothetical protein FP2506_16224 [Fulvimarina pelagi HTCC2506]|uniref:Uncharacterized protein n=2 Tax=Fulvimarina pelagi TaxID=217511 RepID=Q0G335_9HYPH|nr:hypothetical protein FP2506_16224 [Fulvimarina pelagi HTCC2506]